jgi:hypothetical protein
LKERLAEDLLAGRASIDPGVFYRFCIGKDVEFICVDTSKRSILSGDRHFRHGNHAAFLASSFAAGGARWRIPFFHHPPYCAGPVHHNSRSIIQFLVPLFQSGGVRAAFCGHEHNFQHCRVGGIDYFVTGGGGKVRESPPSRFVDAGTVSWAAVAHFLIVRVENGSMTVLALDERGDELARLGPDGTRISDAMAIQG